MELIKVSPYVFPGIKCQDTIKKLREERKKKITKEEVLEFVANKCGVSPYDIIGKVKTTDIVDSRHIYVAIMRKYFRYTYKSIGETLKRDHTTMIYAMNVFEDRYKNYEYYKQNADKIFNELNELL